MARLIQEAKVASIKLDVAYDSKNSLKDFLKNVKLYKIGYEIITMDGPGAGWPLIRFYGPIDKLKDFYINEYGGDEDDFYEFVN